MSEPPSEDLSRWLATQRELMLLMAHDLRNPLAAVLANLNFLELAVRPEDADVLEAVADIKLSSETLLRMIENLVTIARLESEGARLAARLGTVDVAAAARTALERALPVARAAGVDLRLELRREPAPARGDATLVEQLIENLATNAVQHARRGQVARVTVDDAPGASGGVRVALDDEGPPFGPVERDFSREGQLEIKQKPEARYSRGLALYLVGLVARATGASLEVRADDNHGHATLVFPAAPG